MSMVADAIASAAAAAAAAAACVMLVLLLSGWSGIRWRGRRDGCCCCCGGLHCYQFSKLKHNRNRAWFSMLHTARAQHHLLTGQSDMSSENVLPVGLHMVMACHALCHRFGGVICRACRAGSWPPPKSANGGNKSSNKAAGSSKTAAGRSRHQQAAGSSKRPESQQSSSRTAAE